MKRLLPLGGRVWMAHVRGANLESGKASHRCFMIGRLAYALPIATWIWHRCNEMVMTYYTNIHANIPVYFEVLQY